MYNSPIELISVTLHMRTKFMKSSAAEQTERYRWQHALLGSALCDTTLLCGTATATTSVAAHHAPAIAACDPQPTTTESCFLLLNGDNGSR